MIGFRKLSVSLGCRALPVVREALEHAAAHPDHNPILTVAVTADGQQQSGWRCAGADGGETDAPVVCARGGDPV